MGKLKVHAEILSGILNEIEPEGDRGIPSDRIADVVGRLVGNRGGSGSTDPVNCYPGTPCAECYDLAYFVSLNRLPYKKPYAKGHISCATAIQKVVQHMQGSCPGKTSAAIIITDYWDPAAFEPWKANFRRIKLNAVVEIYLISPAGISEIKI